MAYDYVVIGAGSAGCAVAARLSEREDLNILLLEAGGADEDQNIHIPAAVSALLKSPLDWNYETAPQEHCHGRVDNVPRGKVLGGSSSINAMVYQRGNPADYDGWAALGNEGWSWAEVLPFFKKAQNQERGESEYHAVGGPVNVADLRDPNPLSLAFVQACAERGLPLNDDFNGASQEGFGLYQVTQREGLRCSAAVAYLHPALGRANLTVITGAHVQRLTFDGVRCTGAVYRREGEEQTVEATREVILCGGAINSPHLLLLSGIGPQEQLADFGIGMVVDLPGVGQHLQDHLMVPVAYDCTEPISLAAATSEVEAAKFAGERRGMLTSNIGEAGGFVRLDPAAPAPELQFHFIPAWLVKSGVAAPAEHGFTLAPGVVGTKSAGAVTLQSADPAVPPRIDPNYLGDEADLDVLVAGVKLARAILNAPALDRYRGDEFLPGAAVQSDEELREFIREHAQTIYHPVGTCKMGNDAQAVVNARLQVYGVRGLRVADASIMPAIVNANTNNPCIMIGEKCADLLLHE